jgi:hypothetical protein
MTGPGDRHDVEPGPRRRWAVDFGVDGVDAAQLGSKLHVEAFDVEHDRRHDERLRHALRTGKREAVGQDTLVSGYRQTPSVVPQHASERIHIEEGTRHAIDLGQDVEARDRPRGVPDGPKCPGRRLHHSSKIVTAAGGADASRSRG